MTGAIHAHHQEKASQDIGQRLATLRSRDKHRTWRAESVDPVADVHPFPSELAAYAQRAGVSLAGAQDYQRQVREGRMLEPLMLQDLGEKGLWLNASTHDLGGGNSLALLLALRAVGVKAHPALVFKENLEKAVTTPWGTGWLVQSSDKEALRAELKDRADELVSAIILVSEDEMYGLVLEGGRYGNGLPSHLVTGIVKESIQFNTLHAQVFEEDMDETIDFLVDGEYDSQDEFEEAVLAAFESFGSRAQRYATAGGNHAWAMGLAAAMKWTGTPGGYWDCTFGSGSCLDCMTLHGRYMTAQEFEDTYHQTLCDGGCNCGFVPVEDGQPLTPDEILGPPPEGV